MFPEEDRNDFDRAKDALKSRFKSVEIEELRGMEFHHKMQSTESIEELGLELQTLASKAFPSTPAKDFDRLLKGRFFQALHVRWQRKLGAPKPAESFQELYNRARIVEQHERQYAASAAARGEGTRRPDHQRDNRRSRQPGEGTGQRSKTASTPLEETRDESTKQTTPRERICYSCKQPGHISRNCPQQSRKPEATGRSQATTPPMRTSASSGQSHGVAPPPARSPGSTTTSRNAAVQSRSANSVAPEDLSEQQLEELLRKRRLHGEQSTLTGVAESANNAVSASGKSPSTAVGPTLCLPVCVGGVEVEALVDTGSQSTIISRAMLHDIARYSKSHGQPLPVLEEPRTRLYGKDGAGGGRELVITAQMKANIEADSECACVTVFVQPDSEQKCLLGMNVLPDLGLKITRANGEPLIVKEEPNPVVARVRLVQSCTVPSLKGQFLKVQADGTLPGSCKSQVLFEPQVDVLGPCGISSNEAIVSVCEDNCMYVPVRNCDGASVCLEKGMDIGVIRVVGELGPEMSFCGGFDVSVCEEGASEDVVVCEEGVSEDVVVCEEGVSEDVVVCEEGVSEDVVVCEEGVSEDVVVCEEGVSEDVGISGDSAGGSTDGTEPVTGVCANVSSTSERTQALIEALGLPLDQLSENEAKQLHDLVHEYSDIFALDDSELGCTGIVHHVIDTGDHPPVKQQPYRTPAVHREKITKMIADMEKYGIISPSVSPWASPIVLVPKKNGQLRFCVDYRQLNAVTKKDVYPLPRIDDILDHLGKAKYFTSLDLASGYWQVLLDEGSRQKSAFTTHRGLYEFIRMPFGLCNAPATFQRLMQVVLSGLEWDSCFVYLDDILIASETFDEHIRHLREVFERLRKASLKLKPNKCLILQPEVRYLGYIVSAAGIRPDPAKIEKVKFYPIPTDATKVRQFLGLASYYRRFIPDFAKIAHPLHALTKKHAEYRWSPECDRAFNQLKVCLMTAPVLSYPVFGSDQEFILETDASGVGLGAVLAQEHDGSVHPIAYASRSLDPHEKNYGITELEGSEVFSALYTGT